VPKNGGKKYIFTGRKTENMDENIEKLLADFALIHKQEKPGKTFLEIAGCPHYENVWSNILAFYLNPKVEHNFGVRPLENFLQLINTEDRQFDCNSVKVRREHPTIQNNRLDIVIETDTFVLGIENKVNASLYNDLADYAATIDKLAEGRATYKIVLSKYQCQCDNGFINVLYNDFLKQLRFVTSTDDKTNKYQILFQDFLDTIYNEINCNPMNDNPEMVKFFTDNNPQIQELLSYSKRMKDFVFNKLQIIHSDLTKKLKDKYEKADSSPWESKEENNYRFCIYFRCNNYTYCCQTSIEINGVNYWSGFYSTNGSQIPQEVFENTSYEFRPTDNNDTIAKNIEDKINLVINRLNQI
jgi:hypothetical protein